MTSPLGLSEQDRAALAELAEIIVPRAGGMPSASDLDLMHAPLDRVLKSRPDLADILSCVAATASRDPRQTVVSLEAGEPQLFELLLQALLGAYYMDHPVRELIGYSGQRALDLPRAGFGAEDDLMHMMSQPPSYRDPDDRGARG